MSRRLKSRSAEKGVARRQGSRGTLPMDKRVLSTHCFHLHEIVRDKINQIAIYLRENGPERIPERRVDE